MMHPVWIEVDLGQLRHNLQVIQRRIGGKAKLCLIVKANAYGHGLVPVAQAAEQFGVDQLGVARVDEGILLRKSGIQCPIVVLGAIDEAQIPQILEYELECSISSKLKADLVAHAAKAIGRRCRVHLEVDTGIHRTGVRPETAVTLVDEMRKQGSLHIKSIYSHFATADTPNHPFTLEQIRVFSKLKERIRGEGTMWHLANSGGIAFYPESYFDMVRPGLLAYGITPNGAQDPELRPILSLKARVSYFKVVAAGAGISYDHLYRTASQTRVVTVPVGYGDGYPRVLSNKASMLLRNQRHTVAGRICMDQCMLDIGPKGEAYVGDEVVLIGRQGGEEVSLWELAKLAGTDPREVLCHLAERIPRVYKDSLWKTKIRP